MRRLCIVLLAMGSAVADDGFAGPEACAPCHAAEYGKQSKSRHALALRPIAQSPVFNVLSGDGAPGSGLAYSRNSDSVQVSGNSGGERIDALLEWGFGAGAQGITPVGVYRGRYFEHRYSYYSGPKQLAVTFGHPRRTGTGEGMLGVLQDGNTISRCFNCHATGVRQSSAGPDLTAMRPGVTCERCHGPGAAHIAAAKAGAAPVVIRRAVVNPKNFPARARVELCGECHRLPVPGNTSPEPEIEDPVSVRYAPIGLMASRCFTESKRLSCVTCHDPHSDVRPRSDAWYTDRCAGCHASAPAAGSRCARPANRNCVECHMHSAALGPALRFTDHRIR